MNAQSTTEALWTCHNAGDYYPTRWQGKLSIEAAYQTQLAILEKKISDGASHSGWKVGLTADVVRDIYDATDPVFGYLLEEGSFRSGHEFAFKDLHPPLMETEILITLKKNLAGPTVDRATALAAIASIAPAFEVPERRGGGLEVDFALGLVDNVSQRAWVWGEELTIENDFDFGQIEMELEKNGEIETRVRGADVMDHQLDTLIWLAKTLNQYGVTLQAGQRIMSGSFTKPAPVKQGDRYTARFSDVGDVSMSFK